MPLQKLQFRPGINRESTTYANEGGWFECDKIRFRSGQPEKIGGWTNVSSSGNTYVGVSKDLHNWITLSYANLNGVGTNQKYYIENGEKYYDITPQNIFRTGGTALTNPFSTTQGSKLITVTDAGHSASVGTWVTFTSTATAGGVYINGDYEIITVIDGNTYTIIYSDVASTTEFAAAGASFSQVPFSTTTSNTSSTTYLITTQAAGGGTVTAHYDIAAGNAAYTTSNGWGAGTWNGVIFGAASSTLSSAITATDTVIPVVSTTGFPTPTGTIVIEAEIITYTGTTGVSFTGCVRPSLTGTASPRTSHATGITVRQYSVQTPVASAYGWGDAAPTANSIGTQLRIWSSDNFGEDLIYAPRGGEIYYWSPDTSTYPRGITLKKAAQNASYANYADIPDSTLTVIASDVQRFVIAFGATPYGSITFDPMLVRWSDQEDAFEWTPSSINQAGEYVLAGGSTIVAASTEKQEILIWTDAALFSMQYLGPPYVWGFNQLMSNISIISPNAIASVNNQTFWMGTDKFYIYNGRVNTLPCTLWQYVFNNINQHQAYQIVSGTNERYNEVWWMYPSYGSPINDRYVIYNHVENTWYYGNINRTAWLDSPLRSYPMGAFSVQNTYLDQTINSFQTDITVINGYSYPASGTLKIDSEYITYTGHTQADGNTIKNCVRGAANPQTNVITASAPHVQYSAVTYNTPNQVMYHENGTDDNSLSVPQAIEAYVQSSDFDIGDGLNFGFVWRMLPDLTFDGSTTQKPSVILSVRPRQDSGSPYGIGSSPTVVVSGNDYQSQFNHNYVVQLFTGQVYTRIRGRQMAFKIISTDLGVAWQLGATRIDIRPDGKR